VNLTRAEVPIEGLAGLGAKGNSSWPAPLADHVDDVAIPIDVVYTEPSHFS
jgi:hypothetical protein